MTGSGSEKVVVEALREGASDYLIKSELSVDLLDHSLLHAIEGKRAEEALQMKRLKHLRKIRTSLTF